MISVNKIVDILIFYCVKRCDDVLMSLAFDALQRRFKVGNNFPF